MWGASSRCSSPNYHRKDTLHFTTFFVEQTIHGFLFRSKSVFILGNAETIIDFECVPTYSQTLFAQIINMDGNVIIPLTTSGKHIETRIAVELTR